MSSANPSPKDCHKSRPTRGYTVTTTAEYKSDSRKVQNCSPKEDEEFVQTVKVKNRIQTPNTEYVHIITNPNQSLSVSNNNHYNLEITPWDKVVKVELEVEGSEPAPCQGYIDIEVFVTPNQITNPSVGGVRTEAEDRWSLSPSLRIQGTSTIS